MLQIYLILKRKKCYGYQKKSENYVDVRNCYIYGKRILQKLAKNKNYQKARDHCHYTGKYRGAVHSICNLKFDVSN